MKTETGVFIICTALIVMIRADEDDGGGLVAVGHVNSESHLKLRNDRTSSLIVAGFPLLVELIRPL